MDDPADENYSERISVTFADERLTKDNVETAVSPDTKIQPQACWRSSRTGTPKGSSVETKFRVAKCDFLGFELKLVCF